MTDIPGALASLKGAADIIKVLYESKLSSDTQEKVLALKQLIFEARELAFEAQEELAAVKGKMAELERKIMEYDQWAMDSKRYQLFQPESLQSLVYGVIENQAGVEPPHYLCTNCYQQRRKSILNGAVDARGWTIAVCPVCKSEIRSGYRGPVTPVFVPS